jgi:putative FmdB family regulatory protein
MTYEYLCTACSHAWEAEQSISAAPLTTCPHCHAESAKRQVSGGAGFILKGGGWYSDLYSSAPKKSGGDAEGKPSTDSTTKKEGAADTSAKSADKSTDKGSSGSSGSSGGASGGTGGSGGSSGSSGSSGTPTSGTPSGSKAAGAPSGA